MINNIDENLSLYISAWGWFITSQIYLAFTLLFFAMAAPVFWIPTLFLMAFCLFKGKKRLNERRLKDE